MNYCEKCGEKVGNNGKFCTKCGAPLKDNAAKKSNESANFVIDFLKTKKGMITIGVVVCLVLIIALAGGKNKRHNTEDVVDPSNNTTQEAEDSSDYPKDPLTYIPPEDRVEEEQEYTAVDPATCDHRYEAGVCMFCGDTSQADMVKAVGSTFIESLFD